MGKLRVKGNRRQISELVKRLERVDLTISLNSIMPYPYEEQDEEYEEAFGERSQDKSRETVERLRAEYMAKYPKAVMRMANGTTHPLNAYTLFGKRWCEENWGTKWDMLDSSRKYVEGSDSVTYCYRTAWSPPWGFVEALSALYPELELRMYYREEVDMFPPGYTTFRGGEIIEEKECHWRR
jgi:hypothetical protein